MGLTPRNLSKGCAEDGGEETPACPFVLDFGTFQDIVSVLGIGSQHHTCDQKDHARYQLRHDAADSHHPPQACLFGSLVHEDEKPGAQADEHAEKYEDEGAKRDALALHPRPRRELESAIIEIGLVCLVEMVAQRLVNEDVVERVPDLMVKATGPVDMAHTK
ncbi:hypothetical protein PG997_004469 [Apiospora hydei]|uniref:Uncharacterized protein n=1 Tax=Apiospora hydei TaxID=1337664 RepID=A0ABR1X274_9PEZI